MEKKENQLRKFIRARKDKIVSLFLRGVDVEKIANREGITPSRVYQILKSEGVDRNRFRENKTKHKVSDTVRSLMQERNKLFLSLYNSGMTLQEIGDKEGVSRERARQILVRAGYTKRANIIRLTPEEKETKKKQKRINYFWAKVEKTDGCWNFKGCLYPTGYGHSRMGPKNNQYAHRIAWELTNGKIPDGLCVLHKCDNRACCNPDHLYIGTMKDNSQDRENRGRGNRHIKEFCKRGHPLSGDNLYIFSTFNGKERRVCKACTALRGKERYQRINPGYTTGRKKEFCKKGHPMSGDNLYTFVYKGKEVRSCKACHSAKSKERYQARIHPAGEPGQE